ncbi:MAG: ABC transporter substrate-binding protein [Proteobacteria bacterium]|nr:ABC transporter substrate-binding protein [Burkholderiales bacterium]
MRRSDSKCGRGASAAVALVLAAACGFAPWGFTAPATAALRVVDDRGRTIELARPAQRVISLLPSTTETVCELDACERLVGTDRSSNWPASVKALPKLGGLEDAQIERIVSLKPDVVFAATSTRALDRLDALGVKVLALEPKTFADTRRVLETVAVVLGKPGAGDALWQRVEGRIDKAAGRVPSALRGERIYFEVSSSLYAAGESSFIGELLKRLALGNIVPAALGPFPRLNPEFVVRAQPDLIFASTRNLTDMAKRPGWGALRALRDQRHCGFSSDVYEVLVRPGPRLAEAAEIIADCLVALEPRRMPTEQRRSGPGRSPTSVASFSSARTEHSAPARPPHASGASRPPQGQPPWRAVP